MPVESKVSLSKFNATIKELTDAVSKFKEPENGKRMQYREGYCYTKTTGTTAVLREKVSSLENGIKISSQYERRNNITIDGIPPDIPAERLESKVI